jgi:tripartite ATP-independent transporter DctP family solute receptor
MKKKENKFEQKKISRREFISTSAKVVGAAGLLGSGASLVFPQKILGANKIKMRLSLGLRRGWSPTEACFYFADLVRKKTNGELDIKVFPAGSLGGMDVPGLEGCISRQWELAGCTSTNFSNFSNIYRATELPYLFVNLSEVYKALDGEPGEIISKDVEKLGLKLIFPMNYGFRNYFNNVREVRTPADMKGQKVRTSYSPIEMAIIKAQGGNPTPIAWGEVISALAQGVVDGCGNADAIIYSSKQYEVLKYYTETKYMYSIYTLFMNIKVFNELPKDIQKIIMDSGKEATVWQRKQEEAYVRKAWVDFTKKGIKKYIPTAEEYKLFMKASESVWNEYVKPAEADPKLVDAILKILGRSREEIFK